MCRRAGDAEALERLRGHWATFGMLVRAFGRFEKEVMKINGIACLEWPTPCQHWRDPEAQEYLNKNNMVKSCLFACACGRVGARGQ
eukprot:7093353-Pyramimonas_sp.AAC.1